MDKRPNIPKWQLKSRTQSMLLIILMIVAVFILPYFIVKSLQKHKSTEYTNQTLSLPEPIIPQPAAQTAIQTAAKTLNTTAASKPAPVPAPVKKNKDNEWQTINPRPGDSMAIIFNRLGLTAKNLTAVLHKNPQAKALTHINPRQKIQFLISKNQLEKLTIPINSFQTLTVYRVGHLYKNQITSKKLTSHSLYVAGTVRGSLYDTANRLSIPVKLVRQMTDILNKQVEISRTIRPGDQFSIVYDADYVEDKRVGTGNILALRYTSRGKTFEAIRHVTANGSPDYYTPRGYSLKKAFSRYPIKFSHISSTFAVSRNHPILHYKRAHKGIDLAAPIGTPIQATGDGVIAVIGRHNGYGNMIKIKHDKTYSTIYGHMLRFQRGLYKGSKIRRGQVIGYVGQTGLATGPHCHYELHVNNVPRNPTTIPLPTAAPITSRQMTAFKGKANGLLSRLKQYELAQLASKGKKKSG